MFNYEEYDTTNIDDVLPNEQSVLDDSTFSADDIDNDDIDDLPANVIEEMMRAGGSLIGANQSSILKNIGVNTSALSRVRAICSSFAFADLGWINKVFSPVINSRIISHVSPYAGPSDS